MDNFDYGTIFLWLMLKRFLMSLMRKMMLLAKRPALRAIGSRRLCYNKDMATTYVLHGGKASKSSELYFKKFTSLVNKDEVKILMCYWSRKKSDWDSLSNSRSDG